MMAFVECLLSRSMSPEGLLIIQEIHSWRRLAQLSPFGKRVIPLELSLNSGDTAVFA